MTRGSDGPRAHFAATFDAGSSCACDSSGALTSPEMTASCCIIKSIKSRCLAIIIKWYRGHETARECQHICSR
jgi:hypothetical protein